MKTSNPWLALAYEIRMFHEMRVAFHSPTPIILFSQTMRNAMVESTILHTRIFCDLFSTEKKSKKYPDDIGFSDLFDDWETGERHQNLKSHIAEMKTAYGDYKTENSPCWQFNKKLAHLTKERGASHVYEDAIRQVEPVIEKIELDLESLNPGFWKSAKPELDLEAKREALRLGRELLRGTKYEEEGLPYGQQRK